MSLSFFSQFLTFFHLLFSPTQNLKDYRSRKSVLNFITDITYLVFMSLLIRNFTVHWFFLWFLPFHLYNSTPPPPYLLGSFHLSVLYFDFYFYDEFHLYSYVTPKKQSKFLYGILCYFILFFTIDKDFDRQLT